MEKDPVLKRKRLEGQIKDLLASPVWTWLKEHLEGQQTELIKMASDPRLSRDSRTLLCGRLGLIAEILEKPERIQRLSKVAAEHLETRSAKSAPPLVKPD